MAAEVVKPDFSYVWASGGAIVAPSNVKIQTGWTAEVPPFQWENFLQNRQDDAILHLFQKGISVWSATENYYFTTSGERSYVQGSDGKIYVAVADSLNQNPTTDATDTYWTLAFPAEVAATTSLAGIVQLATSAQMQTGTSTTLVPPVSAVMSLFSKRSFIGKDYIRIPDVPGGLLIQWGPIINASATTKNETYSLPFPNAALAVVLTGLQASGNSQAYAVLNSVGGSSFNWSGFQANGGSAPTLSASIGAVQGFFVAVGF